MTAGDRLGRFARGVIAVAFRRTLPTSGTHAPALASPQDVFGDLRLEAGPFDHDAWHRRRPSRAVGSQTPSCSCSSQHLEPGSPTRNERMKRHMSSAWEILDRIDNPPADEHGVVQDCPRGQRRSLRRMEGRHLDLLGLEHIAGGGIEQQLPLRLPHPADQESTRHARGGDRPSSTDLKQRFTTSAEPPILRVHSIACDLASHRPLRQPRAARAGAVRARRLRRRRRRRRCAGRAALFP
jgi:hypothetical protein